MAECKLAIYRVFYMSHIGDYVPLLVHLVISNETYRARASQRKRGCCSFSLEDGSPRSGSLIGLTLVRVHLAGSHLSGWQHVGSVGEGKRTHASREAREHLPPCAGQAQALPLSYTRRPLVFIPTPSGGPRRALDC